jgi:hypothetical protein
VSGYASWGGKNGIWDCPGVSARVHSQIEVFFLGTDYQWKQDAYHGWASVNCPISATERTWPNKVVLLARDDGTL